MKEYIIKNSDKGSNGDITKVLQDILIEAKKCEEEKIICFEKGEYHFYADFCEEEILYASNTDSHRFPGKKSAINIDGQHNLTIDGSCSRFIMHGKMIAIKVSYSKNITLKNFTWDFPIAATLEMRLINKGTFYSDYSLPKNCQWEIKHNKFHWYEKSPFSNTDYWHNIGQTESYCIVVSDEVTGNLCRYPVTDGPFAFSTRIRKLSENTVRVYHFKPTSSDFRVGDVFEICTDKKRDCVGAFYLESRNLVAENIGVRYMHGFAWLSQMCENITYKKCDFIPEEGSDRKCTSFADLIHVSGAKGKVHIEGCNFSNAHDDPINIHGTFTVVKKRVNDYTLLAEYAHNQQNGFVQYHKGDRVVFYLRDNLKGFENEKVFTVKDAVNPLEEDCNVKQMKVTFTEKLPDEICKKDRYAIENVTYTPDVYIGNCRFYSIPTRGILCTTRGEVLIENNDFNGMTMASIYLSNDCNNWFESGAIRDMTIRNNTFTIIKPPAFKGSKPGILIEPIVLREADADTCIHSNITIENNTFYIRDGRAVEAKLTKNLIIRNNKVISLPGGPGRQFSDFTIKDCSDVIIEDNFTDDGV